MNEDKVGITVHDFTGTMLVEVGAHVLSGNPVVASKIGEVAAEWAHAEAEMSSFLASLMDTSPERTFALLDVYRSAKATSDAARSLARATLTGEPLAIFESVIIRFKDLAEERNKVEHGLWARKSGYLDSLFRVKALEYTKLTIKMVHAKDIISTATEFAISLTDEYTAQRLEAIRQKMRRLSIDIVRAKLDWLQMVVR